MSTTKWNSRRLNLSNVNLNQPQSKKMTSKRYRCERRMYAYHSRDSRSDLCEVRCIGVNCVKCSTFREQKVGFDNVQSFDDIEFDTCDPHQKL